MVVGEELRVHALEVRKATTQEVGQGEGNGVPLGDHVVVD